MLSVKMIRQEMHNTYLNTLPTELLDIIVDNVYFQKHLKKQYNLNKEIRKEYYYRKYHRDYYYEYDDIQDVGLFMELVFL